MSPLLLIATAFAGQPLDDCRATALAPETVLLRCGDETAWFSERPAGTLETVLVDFSTSQVRAAGAEMTSFETNVLLGAASYRGYKVAFPSADTRRPSEGVVVARPLSTDMVRAAGCVSSPYGLTCERMLESLMVDGLPPGLVQRSQALWLDKPLVVPPGCSYGEMGAQGGAIACGDDLFVWVNTATRTQAEQAIADTFHDFATELQGRTGPAAPCTVGGVAHRCQTLVDDTGVRAWFTAVAIGDRSAFQYCLSDTADTVPVVCEQVLRLP